MLAINNGKNEYSREITHPVLLFFGVTFCIGDFFTMFDLMHNEKEERLKRAIEKIENLMR
jgi:hypothetical protein